MTTTNTKPKDNIVYIGKKEPTRYKLAIFSLFNDGEREVIVKARGRTISRR